MARLDQIRGHVESNRAKFIDLLKEACTIPSISAEGQGLDEMAAWLEERFRGLGASITKLQGPAGPPAVLAELQGGGDRTLMIYDHYDVQPVDPIELWESPPFEPTERAGKIFARGVADNKGDLIARLCAIETFREVIGDLPFNIKFFVEGEEESGSVNFEAICHQYKDQLRADDCVWEGGWFDADDHPITYFGCKGLLYVELRCSLLSGDQHSSIAVTVPSAAWELLRAIASLKDEKGRIAIDGFYDDIVSPGEKERALIDRIFLNDDAELKRLEIDAFLGDLAGTDRLYEHLYGPTANIAGFITGYTVPGAAKTVLPKEAMAKMDFRLVPDQEIRDIEQKLRSHLAKEGFDRIEVEVLSGENPSRSPVDSTLGAAVQDAAKEWFPKPASVYPWMVGTGPMYPVAQGLGIPISSPVGVGRPDSQLHAPNENARIDDYLDIVGYTVAYLDKYGRS